MYTSVAHACIYIDLVFTPAGPDRTASSWRTEHTHTTHTLTYTHIHRVHNIPTPLDGCNCVRGLPSWLHHVNSLVTSLVGSQKIEPSFFFFFFFSSFFCSLLSLKLDLLLPFSSFHSGYDTTGVLVYYIQKIASVTLISCVIHCGDQKSKQITLYKYMRWQCSHYDNELCNYFDRTRKLREAWVVKVRKYYHQGETVMLAQVLL